MYTALSALRTVWLKHTHMAWWQVFEQRCRLSCVYIINRLEDTASQANFTLMCSVAMYGFLFYPMHCHMQLMRSSESLLCPSGRLNMKHKGWPAEVFSVVNTSHRSPTQLPNVLWVWMTGCRVTCWLVSLCPIYLHVVWYGSSWPSLTVCHAESCEIN